MTLLKKVVFLLHVYGIIGFSCIPFTTAQWDIEPDNDSCQTPTGQTGTCTPIRSCRFIVNLIQNAPKPLSAATVQLLQKYQCGFEGIQPKVCCPPEVAVPRPAETNLITQEPPDVSNHRNIGLINSRNCGPITIDKIIGGNKTAPFQYPWMALIAYNTNDRLSFRCGGSLINNKYVLTAAHCITDAIAGVRLGEHDLRTDIDCDVDNEDDCAPRVQDYTVAEKIPHAKYDSTKLHHDVGLLRLSSPANLDVESVRPICLPTGLLRKETLVGKNAIVAGWGATETGNLSFDLLKVDLPVIANEDCQRRYNQTKTKINIGVQQICAGGISGKDSCSGDSGGPLIYSGNVNNDSRFVQYGIVSFGPKFCGSANQPGVYTNVAFYMDWILDNMKP